MCQCYGPFWSLAPKTGVFLSMQIVSQLFLFSHSAFQSWRHKRRGLEDSSQNGCQRCESDKHRILGMRELASIYITPCTSPSLIRRYIFIVVGPSSVSWVYISKISLSMELLLRVQRSCNWDLTMLGLNLRGSNFIPISDWMKFSQHALFAYISHAVYSALRQLLLDFCWTTIPPAQCLGNSRRWSWQIRWPGTGVNLHYVGSFEYEVYVCCRFCREIEGSPKSIERLLDNNSKDSWKQIQNRLCGHHAKDQTARNHEYLQLAASEADQCRLWRPVPRRRRWRRSCWIWGIKRRNSKTCTP